MKTLFFLTLLIGIATLPLSHGMESTINREDPSQKGCPEVRVSCPDPVQEGEPMTFTALVTGGDPKVTPMYTWSVSAGTITSGQGTSSITVDTHGLGRQSITATVQVGGYDPQCATTASCTTSVNPSAAPRMFDSFRGISSDEEHRRLDRFATALRAEPATQGFIIAYGGRCSSRGEGQRRADRSKNYLVNTRNVDAQRLVNTNGGLRECVETELWIVPEGASSPQSSPTVERSGGPSCAKARPRSCQQ